MGKSCLKQFYETSPKKHRNWYTKMQNSALASMIKKKKPHFEEQKALKNTFPQQKNTTMKKSTKKKHLFFKNTRWEDWHSVLLEFFTFVYVYVFASVFSDAHLMKLLK